MKKKLLLLLVFGLMYFGYNVLYVIDVNSPDCYANKAFFKRKLKFDRIQADVYDVRCYSDHVGIDFAEEIAFYCDSLSFNAIVKTYELKHKYSPVFGRHLYQWLKNEIDTTNSFTDYQLKKSGPYHSFWYNSLTKRAYFISFSL